MLRTSIAASVLALSAAAAQCPDWATTYLMPGTDFWVHTVEHHDDGSGERPYIGGNYTRIGGLVHSGVARWNGLAFEPVGPSFGPIRRLHSLDDGAGSALFAVTASAAVSRWNGASWTALPTGSGTGELEVFDDGSGLALYSAGAGSGGGYVRRLSGAIWSDLGAGAFNGRVEALEVFDDGSGPALYASGPFFSWNGMPCAGVARWDGAAWLQVGDGLGTSLPNTVQALRVHDDGSGARLVAGGHFTASGPVSLAHVAAWDGVAWAPLGAGFSGQVQGGPWVPVRALESGGIGGAHRLLAVGDFEAADGSPSKYVAKWDGTAWSTLGSGVGDIVLDSATSYAYGASAPTSGDLVVVGKFKRAGDAGARNLARWDGSAWHAIVAGQSLEGYPLASTVHDDGTGKQIYVVGGLRAAGTDAARFVARFDGTSWERVGPHAFDEGSALCAAGIDFGAGPRLYMGGTFATIGGAPASRLAAWDGTNWTDAPGVTGSAVSALLADSNTSLYVGGLFSNIGGVAANGIARFDGLSWQPLGAGLSDVRALAFFDSGSGRQLYASGFFPGRIARWDGSTWTTLPQPPTGSGGTVVALQSYFDGTSERLFVGGAFSAIGGATTNAIASWNGSAWTTYGFGASGVEFPGIRAFRVFDDGLGFGPRLFAAGYFSEIQGQVGLSVSAWDGSSWQAASPNGGVGPSVTAIDALEDATGVSLFAFGTFDTTNSALALGVARYGRHGLPGCDPTTGQSVCDGSGAGTACPCGNTGGVGHGCNNSSATGGARLTALGQANVRADTVTLRADSLPSSTMCLFFQGTLTVGGGAGAVFGDGVRCVGGTQLRLGIRMASGGVARLGAEIPGDPEVSAVGAITGAFTRTYQVWYRDAQAFCSASTFNFSNGMRLRWAY